MKILCLSRAPLDYKGGIPAYCKNLYSNNNFLVDNLSYDITGKLRKKTISKTANINEIIFPSEFIYGTFAFSIQYILQILKIKKNYKFIHLQHPDPISAITVILAKLLHRKIKVVVTWHADIYKNYLIFSPILLIIDFFLFLISYKLIFFTPSHIKSSTIAKRFIFKNKIKIIPFCLNEKAYSKSLSKEKNHDFQHKKVPMIISIGRLVNYKGYEVALNAISKLDENIIYNIIGSGPLRFKIQKIIKDLDLENKVKLLGEIDDLKKEEYLSKADIFLFPSINHSEAYGLVQLEAMFFGLPIINTFLANGVNYLAPENVAITCQPNNPEEIAIAIKKIISNKNLYKKLSIASRKNLERFKFSKMIEMYSKLFKEDIKNK